MPGTWTVRVKLNGTLVFTLTFEITAPGASGTNLIRNWGAEEGPGSNDCSPTATIPGWTTTGQVSVCKYGAPGGFPTPTTPGPPNRGSNFFAGGVSASSFITQVIDLSASASQIDGGTAPYTLSGWLGGYDSQGDNAILKATFKSGSGAELGSAQIGPVTAADRQNVMSLLQRSASGTVLRNTRSVEMRLTFTRTEGSYNDGYADNLSFSLSGGGAAGCSYTVPASSTVGGAGGGAVQVTATAGCSWTATSNAAWLTIRSGASGTANGTVNYQVAANTSAAARTGAVTVAGQTFTVSQAAAPAADAPSISQGGVVNSASYVPATLPAGAIAQGSFFSVFGTNLGPAQFAQATSFPLPTVLGGVSLKVTWGGTSVDAYPVFVSANQINAILPSNAPAGDAQLTVTFQGKTSAPMPMKTTVNNFGVFSTAAGRGPGIVQNFVSQTEQPLNTRSTPAKPGQVGIA